MSNVQSLFPEEASVVRHEYSIGFEQWWAVARECMKRNGKLVGKHEASKEFKKLGKHEISIDGLCAATRRYAAWCASQTPNPRPCMDPQRFLKRKVYLDFIEPDSDETGPQKPPVKAKSNLPHLTPEWQVASEILAHSDGPAYRAWIADLVLTALDENDRPVLQASTKFRANYVRQNYQTVIERAWGREVVVK